MNKNSLKLIVYKNSDDNSVALIIPATETEFTVTEIAQRDTPAGLPYLILDRDSLPLEHLDYFDAWESDFSNPDGYGIGREAWDAEQEALNDNN
jgi:hypothetical protein